MVLTLPLPRGRALLLGRARGTFQIAWSHPEDPPADWFGDEGAGGVREPRRPRPSAPGDAITLNRQ